MKVSSPTSATLDHDLTSGRGQGGGTDEIQGDGPCRLQPEGADQAGTAVLLDKDLHRYLHHGCKWQDTGDPLQPVREELEGKDHPGQQQQEGCQQLVGAPLVEQPEGGEA